MAIAFPTRSARLTEVADNIIKHHIPPKLDWKPVDTDTLPSDLAKLYASYKQAQALASIARLAFEDAACVPIGNLLGARPGQDVAFGYKFGKLSVALTDKAAARAQPNALRF